MPALTTTWHLLRLQSTKANIATPDYSCEAVYLLSGGCQPLSLRSALSARNHHSRRILKIRLWKYLSKNIKHWNVNVEKVDNGFLQIIVREVSHKLRKYHGKKLVLKVELYFLTNEDYSYSWKEVIERVRRQLFYRIAIFKYVPNASHLHGLIHTSLNIKI